MVDTYNVITGNVMAMLKIVWSSLAMQWLYIIQLEKIAKSCMHKILFHLFHYSTYFRFCVSSTSSVNCIKFHIVCCTSCKQFIDKVSYAQNYEASNKTWSNFMCTCRNPVFSCQVTYWKWHTVITGNVLTKLKMVAILYFDIVS